MKRIFSLTVILFFAVTLNLKGNPISITYFSELYFDSTGWKLELHKSHYDGSSINFRGWYLKSSSGQAFFKDNIVLSAAGYMRVTVAKLLNNLIINPEGDSLFLYAPNEEYPRDYFIFGNMPGSMYDAPKINQSLCLGGGYYYDNTPTFGGPNDTLSACGLIIGTIKDSLGIPLKKIRIIASWESPSWGLHKVISFVKTDSLGQFKISCISGVPCILIDTTDKVYFSYTDILKWITLKLWPEETIYLNVTLPILVNVEHQNFWEKNFILNQNYPNPFNPNTIIKWEIPIRSHVQLKVFDILGNEVATLLNEEKDAGIYDNQFSVINNQLPSGIYFYTLQAGNLRQTKKMIVLK
ncbi:MAG: T9SS type A sorting domain-containing protein [Ignavibacteriales bacterium]|nr:T9SS type A sorting domain-containing protein [Ignavibacteriales bacterium]